MSLGTSRGNQQRLGTDRDRVTRDRRSFFEIRQRHVARREQPAIDGAEIHHRAIETARDRIAHDRIAFVLQVEEAEEHRGEDELAREAESVERLGPVLAAPRAKCFIVLAEQDLVGGLGAPLRIVMASTDHGKKVLAALLAEQAEHVLAPYRLGIALLDVTVEKIRRLHDVGISVVDDAPLDVCHRVQTSVFLYRSIGSIPNRSFPLFTRSAVESLDLQAGAYEETGIAGLADCRGLIRFLVPGLGRRPQYRRSILSAGTEVLRMEPSETVGRVCDRCNFRRRERPTDRMAAGPYRRTQGDGFRCGPHLPRLRRA